MALIVFAMGAAVSALEGVRHIRNPEENANHLMTYAVLGLSFVFEFISWRVALRNLRTTNPGIPVIQVAHRPKDPTTFTVLFEDTAALLGLLLAFGFILIGQITGELRWDGVGSICIALVLAGTSIFLARESKSLLMGERALTKVEKRRSRLIASVPEVERVNKLQLGANQVLVATGVAFRDDLDVHGVEDAISRIEKALKSGDPQVCSVLIKSADARGPTG